MADDLALAEIVRLEAIVADDPGSPAIPALAEAHRRAGRASAAEQIARDGLAHRPERLAGRVALGLALLDLGRSDDARRELERVLDANPEHPLARAAMAGARKVDHPFSRPPPPIPNTDAQLLETIDEDEVDAAFEFASPEIDLPMTADAVAEGTLEAVAEGTPDELDEGLVEAADDGLPFANHTLADLLERQGDPERARRMRESLDVPSDGGESPPESTTGSTRVLKSLERWLGNVRRGER